MEKRFLILVVLALGLNVKAQKAVLHSSSGVQIFQGVNALSTAYTEAQNGDTVYLSGGGFVPPSAFDKQLIIFGAGHYPDTSAVTGKTFINGHVVLHENADMFYLEGVEVTGNFEITENTSVNNLTIKRCKINGDFNVRGDQSNPSLNLCLVGNVFVGNIRLGNVQNGLLSNNIIVKTFVYSNGNLISNNVIMGHMQGYDQKYLFNGNSNTLNNNIFFMTFDAALPQGSNNFFNNNVYVHSNPNYGTASTNSGNYVGVPRDSIFINQTGNSFSYEHDFHLQSPTSYIGTDGTQVGIYGGAYPYKEGAVPSNPHIQEENIAPTATGGQLNVQIKAAAQDN